MGGSSRGSSGRRSRIDQILEDILDCAEYILAVTDGKSLRSYGEDRMLRQSVERNFEIIGEAIRRLEDRDPERATRISNHPQIISFRNVLIHGYDLIDHDAVWRVIRQDLPVLAREVKALIKESEEGNR